MKALLDTSVLVPALAPALPNHHAAYAWVNAAMAGRIDAIMTWHGYAETWSVLTRLPIRPPPSPSAVEESLASLCEHVKRKSVDGRAYAAATRRCAARGLRSGAIFDALHVVVAEREHADALVTANLKDFERLVDDASPRIVAVDTTVGRALGAHPR